jgi:hypothetical protein
VTNFNDTGAGAVDGDCRGPLKVFLFNHSDVDFQGDSLDLAAFWKRLLMNSCGGTSNCSARFGEDKYAACGGGGVVE